MIISELPDNWTDPAKAGNGQSGWRVGRTVPGDRGHMYLVHAHLRTVPPTEVPEDLREAARAGLRPGDRVEHLAVHPQSPDLFTLGFYLLSDSLEEAERHAESVCRRLLGARALPQARLLGVGVPLQPVSLSSAPPERWR